MPQPILNDPGLRAISMSLDGLSLRQRVTANNIANIDTPGYKAQHVKFETQLRLALRSVDDRGFAMQTTDPDHLGTAEIERASILTVESKDSDMRNDANNVDMDLEMASLAETSVRYQALTQLAGARFALIKSIVRDSR